MQLGEMSKQESCSMIKSGSSEPVGEVQVVPYYHLFSAD